MTGVLLTFLADRFDFGSGNKFLTAVGASTGAYRGAGFFTAAFDVVLSWANAGIVAFTKVHF